MKRPIEDRTGQCVTEPADFAALIEGMQRDSYLALLGAAREMFGIGRAPLETFRCLASFTRPSDWTRPDREPCCYKQQNEVAVLLGTDTRTIRRHEAILVRVGLLERRTRANGSRSSYGQCGLVFTPAIALYPAVRAFLDQKDHERSEARKLRALRSTHMRLVDEGLEELKAIGPAHPSLKDFLDRRASWPATRHLHKMDLPALRQHVDAADTLAKALWRTLEERSEGSARPDKNVRSYIQATTQDFIESCNPTPDDGGLEKPEAAPAARKSEFLDTLSPQRLYALASEDMRMHLDIQRGDRARLTWHDFETAVHAIRPEVGVSPRAWEEAQERLGQGSAALALFIADARREDRFRPVVNVGGYLRGMVRAHDKGQLNLVGSLIGLSERLRDTWRTACHA